MADPVLQAISDQVRRIYQSRSGVRADLRREITGLQIRQEAQEIRAASRARLLSGYRADLISSLTTYRTVRQYYRATRIYKNRFILGKRKFREKRIKIPANGDLVNRLVDQYASVL